MTVDTLTILSADTFLARLGGLLARPRLLAGQGLHLAPCSSVHTFFMRYAIDVVFVDAQGGVLKVVEDLRPWRVAGCWGAAGVVELLAGEASRKGLMVGCRLVLPGAAPAGVLR